MNNEIILSILTFIAGVFCKLYDDLNDNNLFNGTVFENNKECINEFMKGIHYILLTYVSCIHIYPLIFFTISNLPLMITDKNAVRMPYEFSGIIAFALFTFFLCIINFSELKKLFTYKIGCLIIIYILIAYIFDILLCGNIEFGYKKLVVRLLSSISIILFMTINYYFNIVPHNVIFFVWYIVGYCLTSSFFQIFLILKKQNIE